jgi:hypothetical protein
MANIKGFPSSFITNSLNSALSSTLPSSLRDDAGRYGTPVKSYQMINDTGSNDPDAATYDPAVNFALAVESSLSALDGVMAQMMRTAAGFDQLSTSEQQGAAISEMDDLVTEYTRILTSASYNGRAIFTDSQLVAAGAGAVSSYTLGDGNELLVESATTTTVNVPTYEPSPGSYIRLNSPGNNYYLWFSVNGEGDNPNVAGTGINVDLSSSDISQTAIASAITDALANSAPSAFSVVDGGGGVLTITALDDGDVTNPGTSNTATTTITRTQLQAGQDGSGTAGGYFTLDGVADDYYVWFTIDGSGADPVAAGTGIQVNVTTAMTDLQVAAAVKTALDGTGDFSTVDNGDGSLTITNLATGTATDATDVTSQLASVSIQQQGLAANLEAGNYFNVFYDDGTSSGAYSLYYRIDGSPDVPTMPYTGLAIDVTTGMTAAQVAAATKTVLDGTGYFNTTDNLDGTLDVEQLTTTAVSNAANSGSNLVSISTTQEGVDGVTPGGYFTLDAPDESFYVWYEVDGLGSDPALGGKTGIKVTIAGTDTDNAIATAVKTAIEGATSKFVVSAPVGGSLTITNTSDGTSTDAANVDTNAVSINTSAQGAAGISAGEYFTLSSVSDDYYVWFTLDGLGSDPALAGKTGLQVNLTSGDSADDVATAVASVLNSTGVFSATTTGSGGLSIANLLNGVATDAGTGTAGVGVTVDAQGTAGSGFSSAVTFQSSGSSSESVTYGDLDGDSILDMVVSDPFGGALNVAIGNGDGSFGAVQSFYTAWAETAQLADIDEDGNLDAVIRQSGTNAISIMYGNGDGSFGTGITLYSGERFHVAAVDDFDGDGNLDIAFGSDASPGALSVILGNGDGTFEARVTYQSGGQYTFDTVATDVNNDGEIDLVTSNYTSGTVGVLLGNGDGSFKAAQAYQATAQLAMIDVGDFNNDGNVDVATSYYEGSGTAVLLGNGDGSYQAATILDSGYGMTSDAYVADLDGDGNDDIITANQASDLVSIFYGNGNGTFQAAVTLATGDASTVDVRDLNADGKMDLSVANIYDRTTSIFLGSGSSTAEETSLTFGAAGVREARTLTIANPGEVESARLTMSAVPTSGAAEISRITFSTAATAQAETVRLDISDGVVGSEERTAITATAAENTISGLSQLRQSLRFYSSALVSTVAGMSRNRGIL